MMKLWKDKIRRIAPYVPGEQPQIKNIIKLNTNESPYPPSPMVEKALREYKNDDLRLYPSFVCGDLKDALGTVCGASHDEIFLGNGSDEVLALCFLTFFNSDLPVLFPDITYSFYDVWCNLYKIGFERVPLDACFKIKNEDYYRSNGGIVITNPNAPTGIFKSVEDIEDIIKHNRDCIVIIDEAYIDFGGQSSADLIHRYDNVVVVQTFSKSRSLAGIRVGFALAQPELIAALEAVKNSFNSYTINSLSRVAATAAVYDTEYFRTCVGSIIDARERTVAELDKLGFETLPSMANFIFTRNKSIDGNTIFKYLHSKNIIVRHFNKPRINDYLRITIGTWQQMEELVNVLRRFIQG